MDNHSHTRSVVAVVDDESAVCEEIGSLLRSVGFKVCGFAPIAFITAQEDNNGHMQAQALQAGALTFLRKPFCDEDLLHALNCAFAVHGKSPRR